MVDRISGLPDAVLCHILSYRPTKLAATSVLSTRWRYIFASVPNIDLQYRGSLPAFHDECDQEYSDASLEHVRFTKFINFGLRVILLRVRNGEFSTRRFSLSWSVWVGN